MCVSIHPAGIQLYCMLYAPCCMRLAQEPKSNGYFQSHATRRTGKQENRRTGPKDSTSRMSPNGPWVPMCLCVCRLICYSNLCVIYCYYNENCCCPSVWDWLVGSSSLVLADGQSKGYIDLARVNSFGWHWGGSSLESIYLMVSELNYLLSDCARPVISFRITFRLWWHI